MATRKRQKMGKRIYAPTRLMVIYRKRLMRMVAGFRPALLKVIVNYEQEFSTRVDSRLPGVWERERGKGPPVLRTNARNVETVTRVLAGFGMAIETRLKKAKPNLMAQGVGSDVQKWSLVETDKSFGKWKGVAAIKPDKVVGARDLTRFVKENVALIKSIPKQLHAQVREEVQEAWSVGRDPKILRARLMERLSVTESRARLIAKDQVQKLHSRTAQNRQQQLGCVKFVWSCSLDERVRGNPSGLYPKAEFSHWARDGVTFRYDDPPKDGLPGEPVNCRCVSIPVIPDEIPVDEDA